MSGEVKESKETWRERLLTWKEILREDKFSEKMDSLNAKYVVDFDMQEVEKSFTKEIAEKISDTENGRALWISKRWWRYRPKLPYTYFLHKLDCSEVLDYVCLTCFICKIFTFGSPLLSQLNWVLHFEPVASITMK